MKILGPFSELLTMNGLPLSGPLADQKLQIMKNAGIVVNKGLIVAIDCFDRLDTKHLDVVKPAKNSVALPGFIDAHTHLCFEGCRASDYALRLRGETYQEIAAKGGGIIETVQKTTKASQNELVKSLKKRLSEQLQQGITTCEIKSGYGLTIDEELKMLRAIKDAKSLQDVQIVPTCLAAHIPPKNADPKDYLKTIVRDLFPLLKKENLATRIDIFVEKNAFSPKEAIWYLSRAKLGSFSFCVHANQFSRGGATVAAKMGAMSADHLEVITEQECEKLKANQVVALVLPGASMGLGMPFAKARKMLDLGLTVAIGSDWNPGSAPMGKLLLQAAVMGAKQKLTMAETLAAITTRAARALGLANRGVLKKGNQADIAVFPCQDWQEILYYQGSLMPNEVWIRGKKIKF